MREVPISCGLLAFPPAHDEPLALGNRLRYFASVFNGSFWLAVTRRDKDATWRSLGTLCRELDWSRPRLIYKLQNGLPYRTVPPGHAIDWRDLNVVHRLDVEASTVTLVLGVPKIDGALTLDTLTVGIEVLPPTNAETPSPPEDALPTARWAVVAARKLQAENKIPEGAKKADLARLLATESERAVKAGELNRVLKASYIENQLDAWGIWPLSSLK
jgi:hypothetical protein